MLNTKDRAYGFTLIEILVVVGIIGILTSITLLDMSAARLKAKDLRVGEVISQLRSQIETDYDGSYDNSFTDVDTLVTGGNYDVLMEDLNNLGVAFIGKTNAEAPFTEYAIYGELVSEPGNYTCADSSGNTNPKVPLEDATASVCPVNP